MLYIGTSGWSYKHWGTRFYPPGLVARDQLKFLARHFPTVELNASFYRLPAEKTFAHWSEITPPEFRFAVKATKAITHLRRLADVQGNWEELLSHAAGMGEKLGVYLLQFPPSFRATEETLGRLAAFLDYAQTPEVRLAFEFRHATWFEEAALGLFQERNLCLVQSESSRYPHSPAGFSPAPFAYYRFHGPRQLYGSQYTDDELQYWADLIGQELSADKDVYAYFDNDMQGYALDDARRLMALLAG